MFRSLLCKSGGTLKRAAAIINGESSSSTLLAAKYFLLTFQNQNVVVISNSRVTSIFCSFSTNSSRNGNGNVTSSDSEFLVSYLINSCGLTQEKAVTASGKLNFKTTSNPDSVLALLKAYEFTDSHISRLILRYPAILSSNPHKTLKPKFDFFKSKGIHGLDLANFISNDPKILRESFNKGIIPSFDILKSILQTDQNVIKIIKRCSRVLCKYLVRKTMGNLELLLYEGVPQTKISYYLIQQPRSFMLDHNRFKKIAQSPRVFSRSLKERLIPRCSVIGILVSKGLIKKMISISALSTMVDECFLEKFVMMYEQEVPELMKVFQGQLSYQDLLQN
ncbi:uncharacterized protein LOC113323901 [Papaver somniferum]|uniref:uncharacterized protein LOC113323901 n=1 Tax=Papaver somniferum TaxID=3469 RepID=UPI000E705B4D|nr:uncharacterized protein LOC113323901 [Papaver somniferum]